MKNRQQKVTRLVFETYLAVIKNSLGSKLFRNFYAKVNGNRRDIMRNGELSCAFYVSSILALFKFIKGVHGTVDATVKDLQKSGWKEISKPTVGSVVVWGKKDFGHHNIHKHIGFFVGHGQTISHRYEFRCPVRHHWTFNAKRKVEMILWNQKLK